MTSVSQALFTRDRLRCPVCHAPLAVSGNGMECTSRHRFDFARQGYLNLLLSHKMNSRQPGDNQDMVAARTRFLDAGHYQPVSDAVAQAATQLLTDREDPVILDAGCGEGYYTHQLKTAIPNADLYALDISKPAIRACCQRSRAIHWLIGSVADLPMADNSTDLVVSIFSRIDWDTFARVLKPAGHLVILAPGANHLMSLREAIYEEVRSYQPGKVLNSMPETYTVISEHTVQADFCLNSAADIRDLLAMTPHNWHISAAQRQRLDALHQLQCTAEITLYTLQLTQ
ncbi:putative RNA methyltransferase [Kistimonas asteriae]|uniref:putative RNA methyltransferase n=1 Tax=Kistimonas asteriae TaxID=517724 RepID=UPI001BAAEBA1|nr:methyltransferase domain-containing protein [Kistimonas asteriae]